MSNPDDIGTEPDENSIKVLLDEKMKAAYDPRIALILVCSKEMELSRIGFNVPRDVAIKRLREIVEELEKENDV